MQGREHQCNPHGETDTGGTPGPKGGGLPFFTGQHQLVGARPVFLRAKAAQSRRHQQHRRLTQEAAALHHGLPASGIVQVYGPQPSGLFLPVGQLRIGQGSADALLLKMLRLLSVKALCGGPGLVLHCVEVQKRGVGIQVPLDGPRLAVPVVLLQLVHQGLVQHLPGEGAEGVPPQLLHFPVGHGGTVHRPPLCVIAVVVPSPQQRRDVRRQEQKDAQQDGRRDQPLPQDLLPLKEVEHAKCFHKNRLTSCPPHGLCTARHR